MIKKIKKPTLLLVTIFLVAIFTRVYKIQKIPTFIYQDEMGYLISAISMNLSGSDIVGTWDPLSFTPVSPSISALDELTTQFIFPFYKLPINNVLAGKLPFILISLSAPFFIAGIAYEFTKSKSVKVWAWVISLFNPWIWQMGRMSVDPFVSFFFYIAGAYLLLKLKNWKKLWSIPILAFGFYNYQGYKLSFIFWVFIFFLYSIAPYINLKKKVKNLFKNFQLKMILPSLTVLLFSLLLFSYYVFVQLPGSSSNERLNTFFTPNSPEVAEIVNKNRRLSLDSAINYKLINKYTVWTETVLERLTETYGFKFLFLEGQEENAPFTVWNHGVFYVIDSILILLGITYLLNKKRYGLLGLILFGLVITVIPTLISGSKAYFYRSSLNIPLLIILASIGMSYLEKVLPKYSKYLLYLVYIASILYFSYIYFVRYPIISSRRQYFTDRVLVEYLQRIPKSQEVLVLSPELEFSVTSYLFYTDYLNKNNITEIQEMFQKREYKIDNISFVNSCLPSKIDDKEKLIIARWDVRNCDSDKQNLEEDKIQLRDVDDNGTVFDIYNDRLCTGQKLDTYLRINKLEQFDFDKQSNDTFCANWLSKL